AKTVTFTLKEPYAPFLSNLATPTGMIVSPAAIKKHGKDIGRNPVGTGAYKFKEWQSNERVIVEAFDGYWDGKPGLKAVIFRPITDPNTRVAEMLSGGIDLMVEVPPTALSQFKPPQYNLEEASGPHVWFLILNCQDGPFKDKRVRQAANYAINKSAICNDVLEGTAVVAAGPTPPAFGWAYNSDLKPYPYDPDKAKSLLKEAGVAAPELTFYVTQGGSGMLDPVAMGTAIQADLQAVGFKVKIETFEWNTFLGKVNPGLDAKGQHVDMAEMAWMTNDPDTLPFLTLRTAAFPDKGGFNSGYYSNAEVDKLLDEARTSTDQAKRAALYKKMQVIVHDDAPWVFVANWKQNAVSTAAVKNFALEPSFLLELQKVQKT
ncbi:ABC transporter substrate-binding protein, partial [Thioclava sp. BHET1]